MRRSLGFFRALLVAATICLPAFADDPASKYIYDDAQLFDLGERREYAGEHLRAISLPLGGVGAGAIHIDGRGVRHMWGIFGCRWDAVSVPGKEPIYITRRRTNAGYEPLDEPKPAATYMAFVPDSFFAVRAQRRGGEAVVRALQTVDEGPFTAMEALTFRGEYPFAWFDFADAQLPVRVTMEAFNPLVPLNAKDSAIPTAIHHITVENPGDADVDVGVLATQQNAVGYTGVGRSVHGRRSGGSGFNINTVVRRNDATMLHMTGTRDDDHLGYGDMALASPDPDARAIASWDAPDPLHGAFVASARLEGPREAGPTPEGETLNGAVASTFTLAPGESRTVTLVLTWHFPNAEYGNRTVGTTGNTWGGAWYGEGNRYAGWWADAAEVAAYVLDDLDRLTSQTRLYHASLYRTNLPRYLVDRISSQVTPIRTRTVWWDRGGYFGAYEGMDRGGGSCPGNCTHVWHYAQSYARLFPELGRIMREQELRFQDESGFLPYRLRVDREKTGKGSTPAIDGTFGSILGIYREYTTSTDAQWMLRQWPQVKRAMNFAIATWDRDETGMLSGMQHNTLDGEIAGTTAWIGSLYIAALRACERMAEVAGDSPAAERYRALHEVASRRQHEALFNGRYYQQQLEQGQPDDWYAANHPGFRREHPAFAIGENYGNGSHIDQLLGQWWADQVELGTIYDRDAQRTAMRNLFLMNFRLDHTGSNWPLWVVDDAPGLINCVWPDERPQLLHGRRLLGYHQCVLTGFEYAAAATMIRAGLLSEGFTVVRAIADRHDGRVRQPLHRTAWEYGGNPFGDDESGAFYARAQSAWSLLLAAQGFIHHGPQKRIGFKPVWQPHDHTSFFTASEGWGVYTQTIAGEMQQHAIEIAYGQLDVHTVVLELAEGVAPRRVRVTLGNQPVTATFTTNDRELIVTFGGDVRVAAPQTLHIQISSSSRFD
jgi:non-lysosomal glucosylceramidase